MTKLSNIQLEELIKLQKLTVDENPDLKTILNEICYINPTDEYPWGQNYDVGQYIEYIPNFNSNAYNKYINLLTEYNLTS